MWISYRYAFSFRPNSLVRYTPASTSSEEVRVAPLPNINEEVVLVLLLLLPLLSSRNMGMLVLVLVVAVFLPPEAERYEWCVPPLLPPLEVL